MPAYTYLAVIPTIDLKLGHVHLCLARLVQRVVIFGLGIQAESLEITQQLVHISFPMPINTSEIWGHFGG